MKTHVIRAQSFLRRPVIRYALAVLAILIATLVRWPYHGVLGHSMPFVTYFPAVALVALLCGAGPALLATVGGLLLALLLFPISVEAPVAPQEATIVGAVLFCGGCALICLIAALLRRSRADEHAQQVHRIESESRRREQELLHNTDQRFHAMLQAVPSLTFEGDTEGGNIFSSKQWSDYTGMTQEETAGWGWVRAIHPDDVPRAKAQWQRAMDGGALYESKHRLRRADGVYRWFIVRALPARDENGRIVRWSGSLTDIEDFVRVEEELRQTHGRLATVLQNMSDGFVALDRQLRFLYLNPTAARIMGATPERLLGRPAHEMCPSPNCKEIIHHVRAAADERVPITFEFYSIEASRWYECRLHPSPQWLTVYFNDVTQRKQVEQSLRESEERVRLTLEAADVGFYERSFESNRTHWSSQMYHVIGLPPEYFGEQPLERLSALLHPEDRDRFSRELQRAIESHSRFGCEYRIVLPDGEMRWISDTAQAYYDDNGKPTRMTGIIANTTQRKASEEALAAAKVAAEQMNQAKDRFLAILSHELRTPLTPVLAGVSLLQEQSSDESDTGKALAVVRRNIEMEARLIDDLLDVARIGGGKIQLQRSVAHLDDIVRGALEVSQADLERRGLSLKVDLGDAGAAPLMADSARLQQVFWNLLSNATKFTPAGGRITITGRLEEGSAIIDVQDSGEGIAPSLLPHIFNAFEQGGAGVTQQFGGLGLGLTITRNLVEMHGGSITAMSEGKGKGATFRVRLPVASGTEAAEDRPAPAVPQQRSLRVLLVEDHADTARIMARLLISAGHQVMTTDRAQSALELAEQQPFDLIVSDLGLPDQSGVDLMRELRRRGSKLYGIALSGYGQEEDIQRSEEAGFAEHLVKPVTAQRLRSAVLRASSTDSA